MNESRGYEVYSIKQLKVGQITLNLVLEPGES